MLCFTIGGLCLLFTLYVRPSLAHEIQPEYSTNHSNSTTRTTSTTPSSIKISSS